MIGDKTAKPAKFHTIKRFGRRLKAFIKYPIVLPRGLWYVALFFSSWGISGLVQAILRGDYR